jgi:hypothetical protein
LKIGSVDFWVGLLGPPILAGMWVALTWTYMRILRRGQALSARMRGILKYGFVWALGGQYLVLAGVHLGWSFAPCVALTLAWAGVLALLALTRHRRATQGH